MTTASETLSASKLNVRWREEYFTQGVNRRTLAIPRGAYRGLWLSSSAPADTNLNLTLEKPGLSLGMDDEHFASIEDRSEGVAVSYRETADPVVLDCSSLLPTAGAITWTVWIEVAYSTGAATAGVIKVSDSDTPPVDAVILGEVVFTGVASTIDEGTNCSFSYTNRNAPQPQSVAAFSDYSAGDLQFGMISGYERYKLTDGIWDMSIIPSADDVYDLGSASYRWSVVHSVEGWFYAIETAILASPSTTIELGAHFVPVTNKAYDLGDATHAFRTLYLSGDAGEGVGTDLMPTSDESYDLGASGYRWDNAYIKSLFIGELDSAYGSEISVAAHLVPYPTQTVELGGSSYEWKTLYLSSVAGDGVAGHLVPTADDTYDLGADSYRWGELKSVAASMTELQVDSIDDNAAGYIEIQSDLIPVTDAARDLGSSSKGWQRVYISDAAGDGIVNDLMPTTDGSVDLGDFNYKWGELFVSTTVRCYKASDESPGWLKVEHFSPAEMTGYDSGHSSVLPDTFDYSMGAVHLLGLDQGVSFGTFIKGSGFSGSTKINVYIFAALESNESVGDDIGARLRVSKAREHTTLAAPVYDVSIDHDIGSYNSAGDVHILTWSFTATGFSIGDQIICMVENDDVTTISQWYVLGAVVEYRHSGLDYWTSDPTTG